MATPECMFDFVSTTQNFFGDPESSNDYCHIDAFRATCSAYLALVGNPAIVASALIEPFRDGGTFLNLHFVPDDVDIGPFPSTLFTPAFGPCQINSQRVAYVPAYGAHLLAFANVLVSSEWIKSGTIDAPPCAESQELSGQWTLPVDMNGRVLRASTLTWVDQAFSSSPNISIPLARTPSNFDVFAYYCLPEFYPPASCGPVPPPSSDNLGGFVFPNPDEPTDFQRWTAPPFETRLPYQNFARAVPGITRFKKEK